VLQGLNAVVRPRKNLPPLLSKLSERPPERLHYLGVSYGLTQPLHKCGRADEGQVSQWRG